MRRSAYALVAGTGLTSVLGMAFWVLTARLLPPEAVGIGSALISAMTFLGTLSTLGLRNGLVRFLAPAGASARRLIVTCYLLCASAAILAAVVLSLGSHGGLASSTSCATTSFLTVAFVAATVVWVLFVLEDHVLIGLRRAGWVPVTNGIYSAVKIALLPATRVRHGVRALRGFCASRGADRGAGHHPRPSSGKPAARRSRRRELADLAACPVRDRRPFLSPTVASHDRIADPGRTAEDRRRGERLLLHVVHHRLLTFPPLEQRRQRFSRRGSALPRQGLTLAGTAFRHAASLVVPLSLVGVLLAPFGLRILGQDYSTNGTALLRLLLLSAIPQVVIGIALGAARVRRDNRLILAVYAAQALGVFGGTFLTIDRWGLTGVGLSWLVTQTTVALVLILTRRTGTESGGIEFEWSGRLGWQGGLTTAARAQPPAGARACGSGTERMRLVHHSVRSTVCSPQTATR